MKGKNGFGGSSFPIQRALLPIGAAVVIGAVVMLTGEIGGKIDRLPSWVLVKVDWRQPNVETEFTVMPILENVQVPDKAHSCNRSFDDCICKPRLRREEFGVRSEKFSCEMSLGNKFIKLGITGDSKTRTAMKFQAPSLSVADVLYYSADYPSAWPADNSFRIYGSLYRGVIGNKLDLIRNDDGSVSNNFGIVSNPGLPTAKASRERRSDESQSSDSYRRIFEACALILRG